MKNLRTDVAASVYAICVWIWTEYYRKCVCYFLSLKFGAASDASWKASCNLMIPVWQNWCPHAKHLGRWHAATRLIAGQICGLSLMCKQGPHRSSALALNNPGIKGASSHL